MSGPLTGLLVVALEQAVAAPACTVRLADAGARVIKVERAGGETARHYDQAVMGTSAYFAWLNRGKESVVLDIKAQVDRALLNRMIARADVVVQNMAPGSLARIGLGAADLLALHPRLIVVDIVGYGQSTPARDMRAYDMLIQAEAGLCAVTGTPEVPSKVGVSIADIATGMTAHAAVLEALISRGLTGRGRAIEIAMFDVLAEMMSVPLLHHEADGRVTQRSGLAHASIYPYRAIACQDGELVFAVQNPGEWARFCDGVLQRPELRLDPRFADNPARSANRSALDAVMEPVFAARMRAEMITRLEASALAWSRVSSVANLAVHPALRRMAGLVPGGDFLAVAPPWQPDLRPRPVPALGAQTDAVRAEFAS